MNDPACEVISYSEAQNHALLQFEKDIVQGGQIQLEIVKEHFLSRAAVFRNFRVFIATNAQNNIMGTAIGAETTIEINGEKIQAGFGFDAKVSPDQRRRGLGRKLAKEMYRQFFKPNGLSRNYMTAKLSNAAVLKMISGMLSNVWVYNFTYLTIPTSARMKPSDLSEPSPDNFGVRLFDPQSVGHDYYTLFENGLGCFHSHKMYQLKIKKVKFIYRTALSLLRKYYPSKYQNTPKEGETMSFSVLYNHSIDNLPGINLVLQDLERKGIGYLLVCCKKRGAIYRSLNGISINSYDYNIVTDFHLNESDAVNLDVRCL
ncbi:GNAT family N-acetyltransferase [Dyadobacter fermentans]|uniref:GNAT family N-acetyltransferase n=1 Tax=Dyadobacter fermentans TaxID=94254 RepID=UPI001CBD934B|nr:GNAT family N-acetyltransferase [Dyadobacter fermentans]MBZ1361280.1 GNAT family N-acetyltransferase [Dyadobacter fermentans]